MSTSKLIINYLFLECAAIFDLCLNIVSNSLCFIVTSNILVLGILSTLTLYSLCLYIMFVTPIHLTNLKYLVLFTPS